MYTTFCGSVRLNGQVMARHSTAGSVCLHKVSSLQAEHNDAVQIKTGMSIPPWPVIMFILYVNLTVSYTFVAGNVPYA